MIMYFQFILLYYLLTHIHTYIYTHTYTHKGIQIAGALTEALDDFSPSSSPKQPSRSMAALLGKVLGPTVESILKAVSETGSSIIRLLWELGLLDDSSTQRYESSLSAAGSRTVNRISNIEKTRTRLLLLLPEAHLGTLQREQPTNTTTDDESKGLTDGTDLRSFYDGRLTERGRTYVVTGRSKCHPRDIADYAAAYYRTDPMDTPICSYEIGLLAVWLVQLSKKLNCALELPRSKDWTHVPWALIVKRFVYPSLYDSMWTPITSSKEAAKFVSKVFRFDLRYLATVRVSSSVVAVVVLLCYRLSLISSVSVFVCLIVLGYAMYEGAFKPSYTFIG